MCMKDRLLRWLCKKRLQGYREDCQDKMVKVGMEAAVVGKREA